MFMSKKAKKSGFVFDLCDSNQQKSLSELTGDISLLTITHRKFALRGNEQRTYSVIYNLSA